MKVKILLFGSVESCNKLATYLRDEELVIVGSINSENQVLDTISKLSPDLIILTNITTMTLRVCNQIYLLRPRCIPVVITENEDFDLLQKVIRTGVHNIFSSNITPMEFIAELKAICGNEKNRIVSLENTGISTAKAKVISFYSAKDGVGKTTLAINTAIKLSQRKNRVVVLDYNLQFGDIASYLDIKAKGSITELLQEQASPSIDVIRQFLSVHVSGVSVLPAPFNPEEGEKISPLQATGIVSALRTYFDYVIIDLRSGFDNIVTDCIDLASYIFVVSGCDVPSLLNTKKSLSIIKAFTEEEKIKLIMGRMDDGMINISEIKRVMSTPVWNVIPEEKKVAINAANQGNPIVLSAPKSKISKVINQIVNDIDRDSLKAKDSDEAGNKKQKRSLFKKV